MKIIVGMVIGIVVATLMLMFFTPEICNNISDADQASSQEYH